MGSVAHPCREEFSLKYSGCPIKTQNIVYQAGNKVIFKISCLFHQMSFEEAYSVLFLWVALLEQNICTKQSMFTIKSFLLA